MSKNIYILVEVEENGKFYAYVQKTGVENNLVSVLAKIKGIKSANVYPKQKAHEVCRMWNEGFKANGKYLFDEPLF